MWRIIRTYIHTHIPSAIFESVRMFQFLETKRNFLTVINYCVKPTSFSRLHRASLQHCVDYQHQSLFAFLCLFQVQPSSLKAEFIPTFFINMLVKIRDI